MSKYFAMNKEDTVSELNTDIKKGLTSDEAAARLAKYGPNSLGEEKKTPLWKRFLLQFADAMVFILIGAAILSGYMAMKEGTSEGWIDVIVIVAIIILNAVLGVYQEGKADKALDALKKMSSPKTKTLRDGKVTLVESESVVPGDVVLIDAGDAIASDMRLIESESLKADESSLTGESVPAEKDCNAKLSEDCGVGDRSNMVFSGTVITYGRGKGVVTATGTSSELGKIAERLGQIKDETTPLQKGLNTLGKILAIVCVLVCLIVFAVDLFVQHNTLEDSLMTAVSLAVAAIPEGLAAVVTIVLSVGMTTMAQRNAIVKKLSAVETLGCVDVICSDKTGTLTQNQMTVRVLYSEGTVMNVTGGGYAPEGEITDTDGVNVVYPHDLVLSAVLCNDASIVKDENGKYTCIGDPTEGALTTLGTKCGLERDEIFLRYPRQAELPFDSDRKMMTTFHDIDGKFVSYTKGAPDIMLSRCSYYDEGGVIKPMTAEVLKRAEKANHDFACKAIRVLAFAYRVYDDKSFDGATFASEEDMVFLGLIGMIDPPRDEARDAIAVCRQAGIRTVMITGDYKDSASAIADSLNMCDGEVKALSGGELEKMTDADLRDAVDNVSVYARVAPEHKVRIVTALKDNGHIASMTGDGVNDAPALKAADIGVAMGITGTDVAKNSADMILMDDNFATIVGAVEQGRIIYSNIRKFVGFLLSCNIGEILIVFLISLIPNSVIPGIAAPMTAIQLLWLNLVTDSFPALALGREKGEPGIMKVPPRKKGEPIINGKMRVMIAVQAVVLFISVASAFLASLMSGNSFFAAADYKAIDTARTVAFATLICAELFRAFAARSETVSVFKLGFFSNRFMNISVLVSLALTLAVIYIPGVNRIFDNVPLNPTAWLVIIPLAILPFAAGEIYKLIRLHK
ncbi:MAG: cation-translocating P-type ATPase [Clostridiales bacterium]|nr:cation-translocating P-type ATPase [Clostridiales bacterium]